MLYVRAVNIGEKPLWQLNLEQSIILLNMNAFREVTGGGSYDYKSPQMARSDFRERLAEAKLYGILDTGYVEVVDLLRAAESLLRGGVDVLQLRAKGYDENGVLRLFQDVTPSLVDLCHAHEVPLIINDYPSVAAAVKADGVHIGQDDGSLATARKIVGEDMLVGRSTHSLEQAAQAVRDGFDYIGFGPLFPTPTKKGRPGIGLDDIKKLDEVIDSQFPVFCIGGIVPDNLELVLASGARRVVIVSALLQADDVSQATSLVKNRLIL